MSKQSPGAGTSSNEAPRRPAFTPALSHINVNEPHGLNIRRQEEFCLASTTSRLRYANLPPYLSNALKKHRNNFFWGYDAAFAALLSRSVNILMMKHKHMEIHGHNRPYLRRAGKHLPFTRPHVTICSSGERPLTHCACGA